MSLFSNISGFNINQVENLSRFDEDDNCERDFCVNDSVFGDGYAGDFGDLA